MGKPTIVRGWLETMPNKIRQQALFDLHGKRENCDSLHSAITRVISNFASSEDGFHYWVGVRDFVNDKIPDGNHYCYKEGYNAAKAAYEAQAESQRQKAAIVPRFTFENKGTIESRFEVAVSENGPFSRIDLPPLPEKHSTIPNYEVKEIWAGGDIVPVPRIDYETLTRKAALHDDLKVRLDAALAALEEIRRLFV
jgi:hypothetical protein